MESAPKFRYVTPQLQLGFGRIVESIWPEVLYPSAVPDSGATIRIPQYANMVSGDKIDLFWSDKNGIELWNDSQVVSRLNGFIDFIVPKSVVLESAPSEPAVGNSRFIYRVTRGSVSVVSLPHDFYVASDGLGLPAPTVPDYPAGEVDFSAIDSLRVKVPNVTILHGKWTVWSRTGESMTVDLGFAWGEDFMVQRELLRLVEPGGQVTIRYTGANSDHTFTDSQSVYLKAI